ncbi:uncharacterized protein LOC127869969 [Dreissena polymorpha]|uniref:uncharacterized protein LOC127869969 n=1 Tax=Dreissena polymorpha TaxID=45954 RepID=UPI0022642E98|nr:uncharacterized protein LOC127869969 [Dreissena polymorpha]
MNVNAAHVVERDLYVDNVISSFKCEKDLLEYFTEARQLMSTAVMNLRSWISNSACLRTAAENENVSDTCDVTKVLGLRWDPKLDTINFVDKQIPILEKVTKRTVLKFSSQIYDPLGLLSPVTVRAKILLQEMWKQKYDWDTPLPSSLHATWSEIATDLNTVVRDTSLRRQLIQSVKGTGSDVKPEMHVFVDASNKAYGAAVYICNRNESRLVIAKSRVTPVKSLSLPQLELMAALIGARLATKIQSSLHTTHITFWSDSQIVLHWLSTTNKLKKFVANRVSEINTLTNTNTWKYCPTHDNPADLLTRGVSANVFMKSSIWQTGPEWITDTRRWPIWETEPLLVNTILDEHAGTEMVPSHVLHTDISTGSLLNLQSVINISDNSSYRRLLRVTVLVQRFVKNCKLPHKERIYGTVNANELRCAEKLLLRHCQATEYNDEKISLKSRMCRITLVKQLRLFIDSDDIIRCCGRINKAPLSEMTKFPILLPKKHHITRLIVRDAHITHLHSGVNATVTHIRQKYWIPAIRQCVQTVVRKCVTCRRVVGEAFRVPEPPPLPKMRVEDTPPFTVTGVDFTGALYVKQTTGSETKAYICLITCAITRAVHLEVVTDLTKESFLCAFRRFVNRKSLPKLIISDNATTFVAASNHLKTLMESTSVQETLSGMGIEWRFIPQRAPWYGGWWERLIGLTKVALKKVLGRAYVTLESLQTIVTEIEAVLNDRPLTYASTDLNDPAPITPSQLLYGRRVTTLPHDDVTVDAGSTVAAADHAAFNRMASRRELLIQQFYRRWKTEYLTSLREHHRMSGSNTQTINTGDVVQIHDDGPRCRWKLAVVVDVVTGRDGHIRAAKVRTSNGLYTLRPIAKLYPLEVISANGN